MNNTLRNWLAGLLGLQLALAAGLFFSVSANRSGDIAGPLLDFDAAALDKVVIGDGNERLTLVRQDKAWYLPALYDLPVNWEKLQDALAQLAQLKTGWPVATTTSAHTRFEVSEKKHQRRIQLFSGDKLAGEVFIGSSPGFRQAHVRTPIADETYALPVNTYDFPVKAGDWLNKKLLATDDITTIKGPDFVLSKQDGEWILASENEPGQPTRADHTAVDRGKADQLSRALNTLTVTGVAGQPPLFDSESITTYEVNSNNTGTDSTRYQFLSKDDEHYVKSDRYPQVFTLNKYDYDRIATTKLEALRPAEAGPGSEESLPAIKADKKVTSGQD